MDRTLNILLTVENEESISQRQLCKKVGCSLGTINKMIVKLVEDNEIVVRHENNNDYFYKLTKKGKERKAMLMHSFILESFDLISDTKKRIKTKAEELILAGTKTFYLLGERNDIFRITKMTIMELKRDHDINYSFIESEDEIETNGTYCIFRWDKESLKDQKHSINVLML